MKRILFIFIVIVGIVFISGCTSVSQDVDKTISQGVFQDELTTPEGITVKMKLTEFPDNSERSPHYIIQGSADNPTSETFQYVGFGVLVRGLDKNSLDKKDSWIAVWDPGSSFITLRSKYSTPTTLSVPNTFEVKEIRAFIHLKGGKRYPPCSNDDPRRNC